MAEQKCAKWASCQIYLLFTHFAVTLDKLRCSSEETKVKNFVSYFALHSLCSNFAGEKKELRNKNKHIVYD